MHHPMLAMSFLNINSGSTLINSWPELLLSPDWLISTTNRGRCSTLSTLGLVTCPGEINPLGELSHFVCSTGNGLYSPYIMMTIGLLLVLIIVVVVVAAVR